MPLHEELEEIRSSANVPGLALVIVDRNGITDSVGLGHADIRCQRPMTIDTLVRIGSITKTFNAIATLELLDRHDRSLDTRLTDLVPRAPLRNAWHARHPVRIGHLLEHTAGLMDLTEDEFASNRPFPGLLEALAFRPQAHQTRWPPGHHPQYSNVGAAYIGLAIERLSGEAYADFMRNEVLQRIGLRGATLTGDAATRRALAVGYDADGRSAIPYWHMIFPPLGAINAGPREMALLPRLLLGRGRLNSRQVIDETTVDRMETPRTGLGARAGLRYGYGPGLEQSINRGLVWFGHTGDGDGYLSYFGYQKELGLGFFLTFNAFRPDLLAILREVVQSALAQTGPVGAVAPGQRQPGLPTGLSGSYRRLTARFDRETERASIRLVQSEQKLHLIYPDGRARSLIATAPQLYRHPEQPVATIALVRHDGQWILQGDCGSFGKTDRPAAEEPVAQGS